MADKQAFQTIKENSEQLTRRASPWIVMLAKFGYAAKGVVYLLIGFLSALAAFRLGGKTTGSKGVLVEILSQPYGQILLGMTALGLFGYALWRFVQAVKDTENKGKDIKGMATRLGYAGIGVVYLSLAFTAISMVFGSGIASGSDEKASKEWTATVLAQPFGQILVIGVGIGIIAFAFYQFYKAYKTKFKKKLMTGEMDARTENLITRIAQIGLAARGVVFAIVGYFLIQAALSFNPNETRGLSGVLSNLEQQPFGNWLLGMVALGLIAYGIYMLVQAKYRKFIL